LNIVGRGSARLLEDANVCFRTLVCGTSEKIKKNLKNCQLASFDKRLEFSQAVTCIWPSYVYMT